MSAILRCWEIDGAGYIYTVHLYMQCLPSPSAATRKSRSYAPVAATLTVYSAIRHYERSRYYTARSCRRCFQYRHHHFGMWHLPDFHWHLPHGKPALHHHYHLFCLDSPRGSDEDFPCKGFEAAGVVEPEPASVVTLCASESHCMNRC